MGFDDLESLVEELKPELHELVVCVSNSWGGLEQVAVRDAVDRAGLGLRVRFACLQGSPAHEKLAASPEVEVVPLTVSPRNFLDLHLRSLIETEVARGVNLVHCHQTTILGSIVPWLWRKRQVALFASRHITSGHDKRDFVHRTLYSRIDGLIVMSQGLKENVLATHPIPERQVHVVNLGLDFTNFEPGAADGSRQRVAWGIGPRAVAIGLVGRIDPAKGQSTFIKAAASLMATKHPEEELKFVLVGEETLGSSQGFLEELKREVAIYGLEENVVFAGFQENIPDVMKALDVVVMPSRAEAFGLVAIEAMAMERPTIISRGGSSEEIVGPGEEFGLTMRPDDPFDLQRQMRVLLENGPERARMGRRARQHVLRNFDRKTRWVKTLRLYQRALRRRNLIRTLVGS